MITSFVVIGHTPPPKNALAAVFSGGLLITHRRGRRLEQGGVIGYLLYYT
ncbi:MAG: hypothetical protein U9O54_01510 [Chloroflexota bacterium]|nr:hypothetical protein [Chloroflexota bacterium]